MRTLVTQPAAIEDGHGRCTVAVAAAAAAAEQRQWQQRQQRQLQKQQQQTQQQTHLGRRAASHRGRVDVNAQEPVARLGLRGPATERERVESGSLDAVTDGGGDGAAAGDRGWQLAELDPADGRGEVASVQVQPCNTPTQQA